MRQRHSPAGGIDMRQQALDTALEALGAPHLDEGFTGGARR